MIEVRIKGGIDILIEQLRRETLVLREMGSGGKPPEHRGLDACVVSLVHLTQPFDDR